MVKSGWCLIWIGKPAIRDLVAMLADPEEEVRQYCRFILFHIGEPARDSLKFAADKSDEIMVTLGANEVLSWLDQGKIVFREGAHHQVAQHTPLKGYDEKLVEVVVIEEAKLTRQPNNPEVWIRTVSGRIQPYPYRRFTPAEAKAALKKRH